MIFLQVNLWNRNKNAAKESRTVMQCNVCRQSCCNHTDRLTTCSFLPKLLVNTCGLVVCQYASTFLSNFSQVSSCRILCAKASTLLMINQLLLHIFLQQPLIQTYTVEIGCYIWRLQKSLHFRLEEELIVKE